MKNIKSLSFFSKVANLASFLCLIHCLASSVFAIMAPQLLRFFPHNYWVEGTVWTFACASALWMLNRTTCNSLIYALLGALFLMGFYFVLIHNHNYFVFCLVLLALLQMTLTIQHHWKDHREGNCHHHSHHHVGHCEKSSPEQHT